MPTPLHDTRTVAPEGEPSDAVLVRLYRGGDRAAAETLVARSYGLVYRSLLRMSGGDEDLSADLTQETYRRAWTALGDFDGRAAFSTWLYRIALNAFLNHARRPRRDVPLDLVEASSPIATSDPGADEALVSAETDARVRRGVLGLQDKLRLPVTARFWGGLGTGDIARLCRVSEVTVRKRIARALQELAVGLEGGRP